MNEKNDNIKDLKPQEPTEATPGFFGRMFQKLDNSMKAKADAKAQSSCCSGNNDKSGKCC